MFLSKGIGTTHELDKQKFHTHLFDHNRKNKQEKIHTKNIHLIQKNIHLIQKNIHLIQKTYT